MGSVIFRAPQVLNETSRKEIEKRIDYVMVKTWGARKINVFMAVLTVFSDRCTDLSAGSPDGLAAEVCLVFIVFLPSWAAHPGPRRVAQGKGFQQRVFPSWNMEFEPGVDFSPSRTPGHTEHLGVFLGPPSKQHPFFFLTSHLDENTLCEVDAITLRRGGM
jgi:hypothetical protein